MPAPRVDRPARGAPSGRQLVAFRLAHLLILHDRRAHGNKRLPARTRGEMSDKALRVVVGDVDPLDRSIISDMLRGQGDVEIVAECADGVGVVRAVHELAPNLVLLGIQMPGLSGIEVIRTVGVTRMPPTIFVAASREFALDAFDVRAVDYLLKPVNEERLRIALESARDRLSKSGALPLTDGRSAEPGGSGPGEDSANLRFEPEHLFLRSSDISWIRCDGNYLTLYSAEGRHVIRCTMTRMEERLDPAKFVRVRANAIINAERVASIQRYSTSHMHFLFIMDDGSKVVSTRRYRDPLLAHPLIAGRWLWMRTVRASAA
jgi:two-component system LytT family response regulator